MTWMAFAILAGLALYQGVLNSNVAPGLAILYFILACVILRGVTHG
jgi:hypothetical protein